MTREARAEAGRRPSDTNEETALTSTQLLIGGQWAIARSGETEEVRSPYDGSVVGEVPTAGPADVELALAAAERSFRRSHSIEPDAFTQSWVAWILTQTNRLSEAEALYDEMLSRGEDPVAIAFGSGGKVWTRFIQGDRDGVARALEQVRSLGASGNLEAFEAMVAATSGHRDEAKRHLDAALASTLHGGGVLAATLAAMELGDVETAVATLHRQLTNRLAPVLVRLYPKFHSLLDHLAFAPRRCALTLVWPVEAPMIDPVRLVLFKEVKIASGTPGGSSVLDED